MTLVPPPGAAVFDLDGVIVDSRGAVRAAVAAALADNGLGPRPDAELDRLIGPPVRAGFAWLLGIDEDSPLLAACVDAYHRGYAALQLARTSLVPGIDELLGQLSLPLAIATSKPAEFVAPLLAALAIADRFRAVCAPTLAQPDEPKSAILARALAALGAGPDAVMIGDRSFDVEGAHANGIRAIGVTWGIGDRAELLAAGADAIVERPAALLALLSGR